MKEFEICLHVVRQMPCSAKMEAFGVMLRQSTQFLLCSH